MDSTSTVRALGALAQETRLAVFRLLVERGPAGLTPGVIAEKLGLPAATLSFHLKELAQAGLVCTRQQSRFIHYSADFHAMNALVAYLTKNCCRASGGCEIACTSDPGPKATSRRATTRSHAQTSGLRSNRRRAA